MADDDDDKKHDPSERKLREAAERGELPRSQELASVASTLGGSLTLLIAGGLVAKPVIAFSRQALMVDGLDQGAAPALVRAGLLTVGLAAAVPLVGAGAFGGLASVAQTRFQIATRSFEARLEQIDPWGTFQKIYASRQPFVELARGALHIVALGGVTAWGVYGELDELPKTAAMPPAVLPALLVDLAWKLLTRALPVMIGLAAIDYAWTRFTWWRSMMRTDQQAKEDHKEMEGDPHLKAARKRRAREIATQKGLRALKEATVVVTNPTHYAIGLRYRQGVDAAPVIVCKGIDHMALALRREAARLNIPRVEDRPLARALCKLPVGRAVPQAHYAAVAKVLAIVWRRRKSWGRPS
ncbi:MAG: EscU/YscU/HrcU family type III secretion system export apparatus switch protein [Myxococcales bacterium]|nr:EscU/YscU/HrcU family type III secretion system export apparatus switch protein [Myxococcales bacterium]